MKPTPVKQLLDYLKQYDIELPEEKQKEFLEMERIELNTAYIQGVIKRDAYHEYFKQTYKN